MPLYMIACEVANEKFQFSEMSAPKHVIARSKATWQSPEDRFFLWIAFIKKWLASSQFLHQCAHWCRPFESLATKKLYPEWDRVVFLYFIWFASTSIRMRPQIKGLSHGLKIARQLSIFTPVCALVSAFRVPGDKKALSRMG